MVDQKTDNQYNKKIMDQWDCLIPPLNLWNYNLHWKWTLEFNQLKEQTNDHAS